MTSYFAFSGSLMVVVALLLFINVSTSQSAPISSGYQFSTKVNILLDKLYEHMSEQEVAEVVGIYTELKELARTKDDFERVESTHSSMLHYIQASAANRMETQLAQNSTTVKNGLFENLFGWLISFDGIVSLSMGTINSVLSWKVYSLGRQLRLLRSDDSLSPRSCQSEKELACTSARTHTQEEVGKQSSFDVSFSSLLDLEDSDVSFISCMTNLDLD